MIEIFNIDLDIKDFRIDVDIDIFKHCQKTQPLGVQHKTLIDSNFLGFHMTMVLTFNFDIDIEVFNIDIHINNYNHCHMTTQLLLRVPYSWFCSF